MLEDKILRNKILEIMPNKKDRFKLFKKVVTLTILIHYEEVVKENDPTIEHLGVIQRELIPKLEDYMKYNRLSKKDVQVIELLRQSSLSNKLRETQLHFVLLVAYLSWFGVQKGIYKKPLVKNPLKVKLIHTKIEVYLRETDNKELIELAKITFDLAKQIIEKHKYYLNLTDKDLKGE